jgi:hypothetical protein
MKNVAKHLPHDPFLEADRLIAEAVELEKQARRLRERAEAIRQATQQPRIWTGEGMPPGSVRWGETHNSYTTTAQRISLAWH